MPVIALSSSNNIHQHELPRLLSGASEPVSPPRGSTYHPVMEARIAVDNGLGLTPQPATSSSPEPAASTLRVSTSPRSSNAAQDQIQNPPDKQQQHDHEPHATTSRIIPPPPTPRRHKSGVLMSRVRANSAGIALKSLSTSASKSFGDLSDSAMGMSSMSPIGQGDEAGPSRSRVRSERIASEGMVEQLEEDYEESMWDNSARFYHHLHSRPASRSQSRSGSPNHSPNSSPRHVTASSSDTSPIFLRRSLTTPQNGLGPPSMAISGQIAISPHQQFLQQHVPPTFPHSGSHSPETPFADHTLPHMVILTPTTQDWRELKEIGRLEGEDLISEGSSDEGNNGSRRASVVSVTSAEGISSTSSSMLLHPDGRPLRPPGHRPAFQQAISADFLDHERTHTPDPGSSDVTPRQGEGEEDDSSNQPVFNSVVIAPSPVVPGQGQVPTAPETPTRSLNEDQDLVPAPLEEPMTLDENRTFNFAIEDDSDGSPTLHGAEDKDSPARFASIGRRDSLRVMKKVDRTAPALPRTKTKRELEREKLFKMVDEELEADAEEESRPASGDSQKSIQGQIQEIGRGGLASRSLSADAVLEERKPNIDDSVYESRSTSNPLPHPLLGAVTGLSTKSLLQPTSHPFKPSPLHASPLTGLQGLSAGSSPAESPGLDSPPLSEIQPGAHLDSIRDYAKALTSHHSSQASSRVPSRVPSPTGKTIITSPSPPPKTPRSPRVRDTSRISLVAGRIVQPYVAPPNTSLPPSHPDRPSLSSQKSLQSFSPFRSPALGARSPSIMPSFPRLESTVSIAPSTGAPSECSTPTSETAGGLGGRGIDDYVILKEAGKGAYGLVMRAKVKGPKGDPVGDEVIIKYIIKARILADCWKKHKVLGPIPVEIHVMDQLRHLLYHTPTLPLPWDPSRSRPGIAAQAEAPLTPQTRSHININDSTTHGTPDSARSSPRSDRSVASVMSPAQKYLVSEMKSSPERGHPNIAKLLDFFEDREFYYLVMPRFGTGVDLFDRVESQPTGLDSFEIRSLLGQLCDAVRFLHANGIVHRDIKDENVILDGSGKCQLIDFGSAAHWRPGKRWDTFSGTLHYASPEILRGELYGGKEQDVWALGVVAYVLLVGETPFADLPDEVLAGLELGSRAESALEERCSKDKDAGLEADGGGRLEDAADLVRQCLQKEVGDRPTAEALCGHRYLKGEGGWVGYKGWVGQGRKG